MEGILKLQKKIVPELIELLEKRYNILRTIYYNQPIGRRILANSLAMGERVVRTEINFLKAQNLININTPGMTVTSEGEEIIDKLKNFIHELKGLTDLEVVIRNSLGVKDVIIVPGDIEEDRTVIKELGRAAANYMKTIIKHNDIVALTGGSTIKEAIDSLPKMNNLENILVVPARGGMGRNVETQANTLAANLSKKVNGAYKMLHLPDNLSDTALGAVLNEKDIMEIIESIKKANILIYGIGRADEMLIKRGMSEEKVSELLERGAVGEAFGCYFTKTGEVVYSSSAVLIQVADARLIDAQIAVAGGKTKAEAIVSTERNNSKGILITDEGAARRIMDIIKNNL